MMASGAGTPGASCSHSSRPGSYAATVANHQLTKQRSMPAALADALAPCGGAGGTHEWPRSLEDGEVNGRPRAAAGGAVAAVARALWAWIGRGRRKVVVTGRSGSPVMKDQYGHEEYEQNFDEGAAAREPENLARSFSVRYARQRQAPWYGAR